MAKGQSGAAQAAVTITNNGSSIAKATSLDSLATGAMQRMEAALAELSASEASRLRTAFEINVSGPRATPAIVASAATEVEREARRLLALPPQTGLLVRRTTAMSGKGITDPELRQMLQRPGTAPSTATASSSNAQSTSSVPAPERTRRPRQQPDERAVALQQERSRISAIHAAAAGSGPRTQQAADALVQAGVPVARARAALREARAAEEDWPAKVRHRGVTARLPASWAFAWRDDERLRASFDDDLSSFARYVADVQAGRAPDIRQQRMTATDLLRSDPSLAL